MIDLKALYGDKYKIEMDESWEHHPLPGDREQYSMWDMQIPCRYGYIWVYSTTELAVSCDSAEISNRLDKVARETGVCRVCQRGDHDITVSFEPKVLSLIAPIVKPRRKRGPKAKVAQSERGV